MDKKKFNVKVEFCLPWGFKKDALFIQEAIYDEYELADVEIVEGIYGALEVFLKLSDESEPIQVWSRLKNKDGRIKADNTEDILKRIRTVLKSNWENIDWVNKSKLNPVFKRIYKLFGLL